MPKLGPHPKKLKRNLYYSAKERRLRERNPKVSLIPTKRERRNTCPKLSVSTVMNLGTRPQSVHPRRRERRNLRYQ